MTSPGRVVERPAWTCYLLCCSVVGGEQSTEGGGSTSPGGRRTYSLPQASGPTSRLQAVPRACFSFSSYQPAPHTLCPHPA